MNEVLVAVAPGTETTQNTGYRRRTVNNSVLEREREKKAFFLSSLD